MYTYDNLPNSVILRADSHSQKTDIKSSDGTSKLLVNESQFWGDSNNEGLYYDFLNEDNTTGFAVEHQGWDYCSEKNTKAMKPKQTATWLEEHILDSNSSTKNICVFQGYAGCGKTTLVYDILRKAINRGSYSDYHDLYIGYNDDFDEKSYIISSVQSNIIQKIINTLQGNPGFAIYEKFVELFSLDLSSLSPLLNSEISSLFVSESKASLYKYAKDICYNKEKTKDELERSFRIQFSLALSAKAAIIAQNHSNKSNIILDFLLYIDLLWHCAVSIVKELNDNTNHLIIYDNLDIIDDHKVVAHFIDTLRTIMMNYNSFKQELKKTSFKYYSYIPSFKAILTVRKITYSEISKFIEVGHGERRQHAPDIDFLDVSSLYPPSNVLKHKSKVFLEYIDSFIPQSSKSYNGIKNYLRSVNEVPDEIFTDIRISDLLNQNIRACANMIEKVVSSSSYKNYLKTISNLNPSSKKSAKSVIWIHIMCKILRDNGVWDNLGYNLDSSEYITHPTTLSRMILTLLSNRRTLFSEGKEDVDSSDVSFKTIVETFEIFPFCSTKHNFYWDEKNIDSLLRNCNREKSQERIAEMVAKMLQRNSATADIELWRRPIFYTQNSFPILDINNTENILLKQIENFDDSNYPITSFCITDEGCTFVDKIATHFEFSSIRFNNKKAIPLCCVENVDFLDELISNVFYEIKTCLKKQVWLIDYYTSQKGVSKNTYLSQNFHPRTDKNSPQLHIVRMIYDHISYLNTNRKILYQNGKMDSDLDNCLVKWIGRYLRLYRSFLFDELKDTVGKYNNDVWLDLKYLYWLVYDNKVPGVFVSINRDNKYFNRNEQKEFIIDDDELYSRSMVIK